jgi:hypothetical protein
MVKDKVNIPIKGRLWGCSDALRKLKPYSEILTGTADTAAREMKQSPQFLVKQEEQYTLILGPVYKYLEHSHPSFFKRVTEHYINQATELYKIHPAIKQLIDDNYTLRTQIESLPQDSKPRYLQPKQGYLHLLGINTLHRSSTMCPVVKTKIFRNLREKREATRDFLLREG